MERVLQGENGGLLVVTIHEAKDVEGKHHTNPYAWVIFKGEEKKTHVYDPSSQKEKEKVVAWLLGCLDILGVNSSSKRLAFECSHCTQIDELLNC